MWWAVAAWAVRAIFAAMFAVAAYGKVVAQSATRDAVTAFGVPVGRARAVARALPIVEGLIAVGVVLPRVCAPAAAAGVILLGVFTGAVGWRLRQGERPACACFGEPSAAPIGVSTLIRNVALLAVGIAATIGSLRYPGLPLAGISGDRLLIVTACVALAAVQVRQGMTLRAQRARIEETAGTVATQLPIGSRAPAFELPSTTGHTSLHQLLTSGRPQLLVFLQPTCGPCKSIAGSLPDLAATISEWVDVVVIGSGTIDDNALWRTDYGITHYLVQRSSEIARRYAITGTPAAIQIDATGRIQSEPASGSGGIRHLLRENPAVPHPSPATT
ncbi:MauE/DoxX family redox-associated membrane protein [Nocardia sp. NPDC059240]|uniref:MauE/DoxX family redox-associated membrane protein n=1 Tax=Nocardia sp. NPDC059240 TaxID=3346786 RepID=UPI0036C299CB